MASAKKIAIVTGASQGIGAAAVAAYRKLGYGVVATARSIRPSEDPEMLTVPGDLARPGTGAQVVDQALARFGRVDTLVNNAGIFIGKPFTDCSERTQTPEWARSPPLPASSVARSMTISPRASTWSGHSRNGPSPR